MKLVINICSQHLQELFCWDKKPFDLMENMSASKSCGEGKAPKLGVKLVWRAIHVRMYLFCSLFFSTTLCGYFHPVFWCKSETEGETCVRTNSRQKTSFAFILTFDTNPKLRVKLMWGPIHMRKPFCFVLFFSLFSPPCVLIFILTFDFIFSFGIIFSKALPW